MYKATLFTKVELHKFNVSPYHINQRGDFLNHIWQGWQVQYK